MNERIKIIIADDHILFIDGLKMLLSDSNEFNIINIAKDGKELLDLLPLSQPDVVLLDINMPKLNGLDALKYLRNSMPNIKVIVLSTYSELHLIEKSRELGAFSYLLKNSSVEILKDVIRKTHAGIKSFQRESKPNIDTIDFNLTKREFEILGYIKNGCTNAQIASQLYLSIYTIETHRKNIMHKLKLKNPAELMKFILSNNI